MNESERRLLLAIARLMVAGGGPVGPIEQALAAVETPTPPGPHENAAAAPDWLVKQWEGMTNAWPRPRENANGNAKSPARDTTGGAGGGDPLPQPSCADDIQKADAMSQAARAAGADLRNRPGSILPPYTAWEGRALKAEAEVYRLSLVHQQLREQSQALMAHWKTGRGDFGYGRDYAFLEKALAHDATTTVEAPAILVPRALFDQVVRELQHEYSPSVDELLALAASTTETPP